jgi:tetratricopeptide (TPR) repeat protein
VIDSFASCVPRAVRASMVPAVLIGSCLATGSVAMGCSRVAASSRPSAETQKGAPSPGEPSDTTTVLALASTHDDGETDRSIAHDEVIATKLPSKPESWTLLGSAWVRKARESSDPGYYLNANACADLALRASPGDAGALDLRAMVLLNQHRFDEARSLSESVVGRVTDDSVAYGTLSDALLELGRIDPATTAAQAMMDLKPSAASYSRAAHLRWIRGDVAGAERIMREAIDSTAAGRHSEPRAWVLSDAAMLFWHRGDYDGADAGFDLALASLADYPPGLVGKARVRLAKGDGEGAASLLERAYAKSPLVETAWLLGDSFALAGDEALARSAYERVERDGRRIDPRTLSLFESTKGRDAAEALDLAERERTTRDDAYTEDAYAWALYRSGRFAEARRASDAATQWGTPDARLIYHGGAIRIAEGDAAGGRRLVERALALNPRFDVTAAAEARRLLGRDHGSP